MDTMDGFSTTVDFGIDLGTTNSSIAVLNGTAPEVFKNNDGQEITPSVVWIDSSGRIDVGHRAKQQLGRDKKNAHSEFKLMMGTNHVYSFIGCDRQMTPVELSAEVLKSLRGDVQQHIGNQVTAAAIGVPAVFELPECNATKKAAALAGLEYSVLVQEPIAAAIAYGFQNESDRVFWLVYDLGGGTFDAAVVTPCDDQIQLINHGGDIQLGGKLIDWEIVEQLLAPVVASENKLSDFTRGNIEWEVAFAQLKMVAEEAKIRLSRASTYSISTDLYFPNGQNERVRFEYELKRKDIEPLIEPYVERSVNICKKVLKEKDLSPEDIEKLILVGGPTLMPIVREMLAERLKIKLEFYVDPLTVVARGMAIVAGNQRLPDAMKRKHATAPGQYSVEMYYEPIGIESEPLVGGKVITSEGESLVGFNVEFIEAKSKWRSGRIDIKDKGTFTATLLAEKGRANEFLIELRDGNGNLRQTEPDRFKYTIGSTISGQTLINSVGVALANNTMDVFLAKGTPLPARYRANHYSAVALIKGNPNSELKIPIIEGDYTTSRSADLNRQIGYIILSGDKLDRDLPFGSDIEILIDMDESRLPVVKIYVPILDQEFEKVMELGKSVADPKQLDGDFQVQKDRLIKMHDAIQKLEAPEVEEPLQRINNEQTVHQIETALNAARAQPEAANECQDRLLDLKRAIQETEKKLEFPMLKSDAEEQLQGTRAVVNEYGEPRDHSGFKVLEDELIKAVEISDEALIRRKVDQLQDLESKIWWRHPGWWVGYLQYLEQEKLSHMKDQARAQQLFVDGRRAIEINDLDSLQEAVRQLIHLLPQSEQQEALGYGGGTMRL